MKRILVVEDEAEIAAYIKTSLNKIGFEVTSVASDGEEAVRYTGESLPDLVLIDIMLNGRTSGIEAAQSIRSRFDIPVVYLTAHADENILEMVKPTRPFGYLLKPFNISELRAVIEIALHKHKQEKKARQRTKLLDQTLNCMGYAVITADTNARVTFMNSAAEELIGWTQKEVLGKDLNEVLNLKDEKLLNSIKRELAESLASGFKDDSGRHADRGTSGEVNIIPHIISPIRDEKGDITGALLMLGEASKTISAGAQDCMDQDHGHKAAGGTPPVNLALASSSPIIRSGVRNILEHEKDIEVISEASSLRELKQLADKKIHDVFIIDSSIPGLDIADIRQAVNENSGDARILLLLHDADEGLVMNALYSGVKGFVKETSLPSELVDAVRSVSKNEFWVERDSFRKILNRILASNYNMPGLLKTRLTAREREIVELVALGNSNKQISLKLSISRNTVKNHLANVFSKLGITNRLQIGSKITF